MAEFVAEEVIILSQAAAKIEEDLSDDLMLFQMANSIESDFVLDQAVTDYIPVNDRQF